MFWSCVDQANLAVIEKFGKFDRIGQPVRMLCDVADAQLRGRPQADIMPTIPI